MANTAPQQPPPAPVARRSGEWDPVERMRDILSFDPLRDLHRLWFGEEALGFAPRFDAREDKAGYVIQADMPGIKQEDVDISIAGRCLTISGKREKEKIEESKSYSTRERSFGSFSRAFTLPDTVDADHIQASMRDGVLEVKIPKRAESQPKKITVATSDAGSASASAEPPPPASKEEGM